MVIHMSQIGSKRISQHFGTGIFAELNEKKEEMEKKGRKLYNLFVGTPDFAPAPHIMEAVQKSAANPEDYKYSLVDIPELLDAVVDYYQERFQVSITPDMITGVHGSQEGIGHVCMALCDPGDVVLLPNPGYPIFEAGAYLAQTEQYFYDLKEENHFLPVLSEIPEDIARRAKVMIVSYPYNPVCKTAPASFYDELIAFARKYDILIIHDNAYSDIIFDGAEGGSFLATPGAREVGVEFFSLSKSFNVTGARMSFLVGRPDVIAALRKLRSQIDFGMFLPIQKAALAALTGPLDSVKEQCRMYEERRDTLCQGLRDIGWELPNGKGTMFVWAKIPGGRTDSMAFCMELMEKAGVIVTPGSSFGPHGEGYVRFALVLPPEKIREAVESICKSGL